MLYVIMQQTMTEEEAVVQMDLVGHDFFIFMNMFFCNRINV